ncbi:MAG TPA: FtsQ-type POTRA domain-containing protein [bacterium]|nr:FtsQ-type POTRA domain-containing protein [bacterium]
MATSAAHLEPAAAPAADPAPPAPGLSSVQLLLRFATVMAVALGIAALPTSSLFAVRSVQVHGAVQIPAAEVAVLTGLRPGDRLFAVPAREVVARVMRHPRVARATVRINAAGEVIVRVAERIPYAAFPFQGRYLILDHAGVVIDDLPSSAGLPVVTATGFVPEWTRLGDRLPSGGVDRAIEALARLPGGVAAPGTRLRVEPQGDIVLFTPDGIAVRLGPVRGLEERAALMREVLDAVRARGLAVEYLDLRFSGNVVMKPSAGTTAGEAGDR